MTISNKVEGLDLAELEKVAREALANKPHAQPWERHSGRLVKHANPWNAPVAIAQTEAFAEHIATFDPPTVLRLIEANRELLAALESALNGLVAAQPVLSFVPKNYGGEGRRKAVDAGITAARAAIAKVQP